MLTEVDAVRIMVLCLFHHCRLWPRSPDTYLVVPTKGGKHHSNVGPRDGHAGNVGLDIP